MRKFILAVVLAALGATLIATSASAFDSHFKVLGKDKSGHRVGHNGFRFRQVLLEPHNRSNRVGHDRVTCRDKGHHRQRCHALVRLNGEIGGIVSTGWCGRCTRIYGRRLQRKTP